MGRIGVFFLCSTLHLFALGSSLLAMTPYAVPGEILVKFKKEVSSPLLQANLHGLMGAKVLQHFKSIKGLQHISISKNRFVEILAYYKNHPLVEYAEPNFIYFIEDHFFEVPNDSRFPEQWALHNTGQKDTEEVEGTPDADIDALEAWHVTLGNKDVTVAVLDTGIDYTHEDLAQNMWINKNEIPDNKLDDDANGYIDDIRGWDFANKDNDPLDDHGHGSHVAGVIGALGHNEKGIIGISPHVSLMPVKFFDAGGSGQLSDAVLSVEYAVRNGAVILNNSWGGGGYSEALADAIKMSYEKNVLFVAAAGNDHQNNDTYEHYPSGYPYPNILAVAATGNKDQLASFSNYGFKSVHVSAPGLGILSTLPGNQYGGMSGTSMACPHVAGVSALLLSVAPALTPLEIKTRLIETSDEILAFRRRISAGGRINAYKAIHYIIPPKKGPKDPGEWQEVPIQISTGHDYKENSKDQWTIYHPGATHLKIHFSHFDTEEGSDFVKVTNGQGKMVDQFDGKMDEFWSFIVLGDTLHIQFESDSSYQKYGFDIDKYAFSTLSP